MMGKLIPINRKRREESQAETQRRWLEVNEVLEGTPWYWPKETFLQTRLRYLREKENETE